MRAADIRVDTLAKKLLEALNVVQPHYQAADVMRRLRSDLQEYLGLIPPKEHRGDRPPKPGAELDKVKRALFAVAQKGIEYVDQFRSSNEPDVLKNAAVTAANHLYISVISLKLSGDAAESERSAAGEALCEELLTGTTPKGQPITARRLVELALRANGVAAQKAGNWARFRKKR